jgi:serine/threonine protein kinase
MRAYNPPFIKASLADIYYRLLIENDDYFWAVCLKNKSPDHFSSDFRKLIKGMLALDPEERWSIRAIKSSSWFRGPTSGPLMEYPSSSGETLIKIQTPRNGRRTGHLVKSYRDRLKFKTCSLFNEDYLIHSIKEETFRFLRYSKIVTNLEPSTIVSVLNVFLEEIKASYSEITPELKVKVFCDQLDVEFKLKFYRIDEEIVIYLQKVKGNEFEFIKIFDRFEEIVRGTEKYFDELELNIF